MFSFLSIGYLDEYKRNVVTVSSSSDHDGRSYLVEAPRSLLPELCSEWDTASEKLISKSIINHVTWIGRSKINSYFERRNTISTYQSVWKLFYSTEDGVEKVNDPSSCDDFRFTGIEMSLRNIPVYDPEDITLHHTIGMGNRLYGEVGGARCEFILPSVCTPTRLTCEEIFTDLATNTPIPKSRCFPRFKGFIGFAEGDHSYNVIGLVFECITGEPLSSLSVPDSLKPELRAQIKEGYEQLRKMGMSWDGSGPEDILVAEDGRLGFSRACGCRGCRECKGCAKPLLKNSKSMERVMAFLSKEPEQRPRRSNRVQEKSWTTSRIPLPKGGPTLTDMPPEIRLMIYEHVLIFPEKIYWSNGSIMSTRVDNEGTLSLRDDLSDVSLVGILQDARSFFYEKNHFIVQVDCLDNFLSQPNFSFKIKQITLRVDAFLFDGSQKPWRESIEQLVKSCPNLKNIWVCIARASVEQSFLDKSVTMHGVLLVIRQLCNENIVGVVLEGTPEILWRSEVPREDHEQEILRWLRKEEPED